MTENEPFVEYRVNPVVRYVVTRFESGGDFVGSEQRGEFETHDVAYAVGYALCRAEHEKDGAPVGSDKFRYPSLPPKGARFVVGSTGFPE